MRVEGPVHNFWDDIGHGYCRRIVNAGKEQAFWILLAFLVTFIIVRLVTHAIRPQRGPFRNVSVGAMVLVLGFWADLIHAIGHDVG